MKKSILLKLADLGFAATQEQLARIPGLFEVCRDLVTDDAVVNDADSLTARLDAIWDVIEEEKGGGIQSQVAGYAPGSLGEQVCLRDSDYRPLIIASRRVVCDIVNRSVSLRGNLIANGCYWMNVEGGIMYLVWRTHDEVYMMDEAYFGGGLFGELTDENEECAVVVEEPSTGKRYAGTMTDVLASTHDPLFVSTNGENYVITDLTAAIESFSGPAWESFCEGDNPST